MHVKPTIAGLCCSTCFNKRPVTDWHLTTPNHCCGSFTHRHNKVFCDLQGLSCTQLTLARYHLSTLPGHRQGKQPAWHTVYKAHNKDSLTELAIQLSRHTVARRLTPSTQCSLKLSAPLWRLAAAFYILSKAGASHRLCMLYSCNRSQSFCIQQTVDSVGTANLLLMQGRVNRQL